MAPACASLREGRGSAGSRRDVHKTAAASEAKNTPRPRTGDPSSQKHCFQGCQDRWAAAGPRQCRAACSCCYSQEPPRPHASHASHASARGHMQEVAEIKKNGLLTFLAWW